MFVELAKRVGVTGINLMATNLTINWEAYKELNKITNLNDTEKKSLLEQNLKYRLNPYKNTDVTLDIEEYLSKLNVLIKKLQQAGVIF